MVALHRHVSGSFGQDDPDRTLSTLAAFGADGNRSHANAGMLRHGLNSYAVGTDPNHDERFLFWTSLHPRPSLF
jgi:hypothetical protein